MPASTPSSNAGWLAAVTADPRSALLAFDFDGTLSPIVDDPESAQPHPEVPGLLAALGAAVGHVAVVTGRPAVGAAERLRLGSVASDGDIVVLGHYGLERWDSRTGAVHAPPPHPLLERVRRELPAVLDAADAADAYVEDKRASLAVHTRRATDPARVFDRLRGPLGELAASAGLRLEPGRLVLELRPPGTDKGTALRGLVEDTTAGSVAFVGDDLGDLAAFDAVDELRASGLPGLLVCSGSAEVRALAERADLVVDGPAGVVAWLRSLLDDLAPR